MTLKELLSVAAIDAIIHRHNVTPGSTITILHEIQDAYGYLPPAAVERVAENLGIPTSEVYGIATFYALFRLVPPGKNLIKVCHGTACHLGGAERIAQTLSPLVGAEEGETSADGKFTMERVACFGCCSMAPCVMINGEIRGRLTPETVPSVLNYAALNAVPVQVSDKQNANT